MSQPEPRADALTGPIPDARVAPARAPEVSIVLLTKNGGPELEQTLAAIARQRTSHEFEIVAIDSGSTDGSLDLLKRHHARLHQIPGEEFNFGRTRELGYELACGRWLVTLSQDSLPAADTWLERLIAPFADPAVAAVQGRELLPPPPAPLFFWERNARFYFTRASKRWLAGYGFGFSNTNAALRRSVWEQNRLGAIEMSEDKLLQKTWTARGLKLVRALDAAVYHTHHYTLDSLARRCENEGLGFRLVGERYSFRDFLLDACSVPMWGTMLDAWRRGERLTRAETLFPFVRPFFLWKGSRWTRRYVRAPSSATR